MYVYIYTYIYFKQLAPSAPVVWAGMDSEEAHLRALCNAAQVWIIQKGNKMNCCPCQYTNR